MDLVEGALLEAGVAPDHIHLERFGSNVPAPTVTATDEITVTIELGGKTETTKWHPGTTILQTGRQLGLNPPSSCESGSCATCMAKCTEGTVSMYTNDALTDDEVEEGWILTCQSIPTSPTVHVVYEDY
jgi:ferredoxin